jgi:RNA polymerase sigma-70 factor (ECF subfamily)
MNNVTATGESDLQTASTAELIRLAGRGDRDALSELYIDLQQPIYLLAYSILKSHAAAEDATQDTFVKVMKAAASYQPGGNARAWILRIAHNTVIDTLRKESRTSPLSDEIADAYDELGEKDAELDFLKAMQILNDREKRIVVYRVFAGLTHTEIAGIIGISAGAVRVRYRRILKRLERFYRLERLES